MWLSGEIEEGENCSQYSDNSPVSEQCAPKFPHRLLVLTLSNRLDQYQLGPSERNWEQTPFICESGPGFAEHSQQLDMRRWRSLRSETGHRFADLTFVETESSLTEELRSAFLRENSQQQQRGNNAEKSLYEEIHSVEWNGPPIEEESGSDESDPDEWSEGEDSCWGDYPMEEEEQEVGQGKRGGPEQKHSGAYILIGYKTDHRRVLLRNFAADWHNWCAVRDLCECLPPKCAFRHLALYRACTGVSQYEFVLIVEVDNVKPYLQSVSNCINNAQSMCANRAFIGLYEEIEFEVDVEVLQHFVANARFMRCDEGRLVVQFDAAHTKAAKYYECETSRPFSLYQLRPPSSTSQSSSMTPSHFLNNSNAAAASIPKSATSEFDAEMDDIVDENDNCGPSFERWTTGEERKISLNNNSGAGPGIGRRKSSWNFIRSLFSPSPPQPVLTELAQFSLANDRSNNNNSGGIERSTANGGQRPKGNFSLIKESIGNFWRKISIVKQ